MTRLFDVPQITDGGNGRWFKVAMATILIMAAIISGLGKIVLNGYSDAANAQAAEVKALLENDSVQREKIATLEQQQRQDDEFRKEMKTRLDALDGKMSELLTRARRGER